MTVLKSSTSMNRTATVGPASRERLVDALDEQRAVGQVGERVVVGLVVQLAPAARAAADGLLEPVVLERDAGVVGERLEQRRSSSQKSRTTPKRLASMIVPIMRVSPGSIATIAWRTPRVLAGSGAGARLPNGGRERATGLVGVDQRAQLLGDRGVDRLHHRHAWSPGPCVVRSGGLPSEREQDDLGDLGAERLERAGEQALERVDDLGRARERAVRLVEELEPLVALALGDVGAVGEEDGDERDDQQRQRARRRRRRSRRRRARGSSW